MTISALSLLIAHSESVKSVVEPLIAHYKEELPFIKGEITEIKNQPIKTFAKFEYNGKSTITRSSISREDAAAGLHSRKIGRQAVLRRMIKELKWRRKDIDKSKRAELAAQLLEESK